MEVACRVFQHLNFWQVKQTLGGVVFIQQIVPSFEVDFHVADGDFVSVLGVFPDVVVDVAKSPRNDTSVCVPLSATSDREGLSRSRLSISKNGSVVAFKGTVNDIKCDFVEYCLLLSQHVEDSVEPELVVVIFNFVSAQTVSLKIKLDLAIARYHA